MIEFDSLLKSLSEAKMNRKEREEFDAEMEYELRHHHSPGEGRAEYLNAMAGNSQAFRPLPRNPVLTLPNADKFKSLWDEYHTNHIAEPYTQKHFDRDQEIYSSVAKGWGLPYAERMHQHAEIPLKPKRNNLKERLELRSLDPAEFEHHMKEKWPTAKGHAIPDQMIQYKLPDGKTVGYWDSAIHKGSVKHYPMMEAFTDPGFMDRRRASRIIGATPTDDVLTPATERIGFYKPLADAVINRFKPVVGPKKLKAPKAVKIVLSSKPSTATPTNAASTPKQPKPPKTPGLKS